MDNNYRILLIGKMPPPIGGVSIHVKRLICELKRTKEISVDILDYSKDRNLIYILKKIISTEIVHIHLSNKLFRLIAVFFFRIILKKVIITFHGMYDFKNYLDFLSIKYSNSALLLNKYSFENANKIKNQNIHLIGSFIPPAVGSIVPLSKLLNDEIAAFKSKYKFIFSTNASNYVLDKHGKEIYMGSELVSFFFENKNYGLIFSDPTGNYYKFLTRLFDKLPKNIYFISLEHDFINVIKQSDALIRATIMDGDSISIKEALYYGKKVFATNVVDRPDGVTCFENFVQLKDLLEKFSPECDNITVENNFNAILALYKSQFDTF